MFSFLSETNILLGKLDGISSNLPDRDVYIFMNVQKEAVVSSQIEEAQASLTDVLQIDKVSDQKRLETEEIMNSVHALNYGINLFGRSPVSIRYLRKVHSVLLKRVRGSTKVPDELRNSQKWVGPMGWNLSNETYIPPSVDITQESLSNLENT